MSKEFKEFLNDFKTVDKDLCEFVLEQGKNDIESIIEDETGDILESISEFGYGNNEERWNHAFEMFKLAIKYNYYNNLDECLSEIWQRAFGMWVDENQRGNFSNFEVFKDRNAETTLNDIKTYIFNLYNMTHKLSEWYYNR